MVWGQQAPRGRPRARRAAVFVLPRAVWPPSGSDNSEGNSKPPRAWPPPAAARVGDPTATPRPPPPSTAPGRSPSAPLFQNSPQPRPAKIKNKN